MGGASSEPLRLRARFALARSLAPCGEVAGRARPDAAQVARVRRAIAQLPARQRQIFLAVRLHDRSLCEIAETSGLPMDVAEREFVAALLAIMRALQGE